MKDKLNIDLIKAIEDALPEKVNLATQIMEILDIGKEATYRRLRSDVPFTFYEVSLLAKKLGLSLDQLIGNYDSKSAVFNLNLIHTDNAMVNYCSALKRYMDYFNFIKNDPQTEVSTVSNNVPYTLYAPYRQLSKFRLCRWLHQTEKFKPVHTLDEIVVPREIEEIQAELSASIRSVSSTVLIWDSNIFLSLTREIDYFNKLNLISANEMKLLKEELHLLLDDTEKIALSGHFLNGNSVSIYLSHIHFDASYTFLEKKDFQLSLLRLYSVNSMDTLHPEICHILREWIKTLKRYSTLITESNEMQRIIFFKQQHDYVDSL